jgi:RNA polymerase sigma-70 factor (ECF subfamily)
MVRVNDGFCSGASDEVLVQAAKAGDGDAWDAIVAKYLPLLFSFVCNFERDRDRAQDVVQEILISVFRKLSGFRQESSFKTWLMRIAFNQACNGVRYHKRRKSQSLSDLEGSYEPEANDDPETEAIRAEEIALAKAKVAYGLESLDERYREVIVAWHFEGLSYQQIAELIDSPIGTVRSRLSKARVNLKQVLEEVA